MFRYITILIAILFTSSVSFAQIDVEDKMKKQTNSRANKNVDQGIDKGLDELEDGFKSIFKKKDKKKKKKKDKDAKEQGDKSDGNNTNDNLEESEGGAETGSPEMVVYSKYDFVPGNKVIFQDDLVGEELGEFPSKWDLRNGNVEIARNDDRFLISFVNSSEITPLMTKEDYLPEMFTIEFDCYFHIYGNEAYTLILPGTGEVSIRYNQVKMSSFQGKAPGDDPKYTEAGWRHIAIAFNKRSLKVYMEENRLLNIPNIEKRPTNFSIKALSHGSSKGKPALLKNFKVAEGGKKLYDRMLTDGKIVTTGILFKSGKATILPESMGVINKIVTLMKDDPGLNFSIEGHTDSDGSDELNKTLSEQRAEAVKQKFSELGIDASRMTTKGYGESVPVADNKTPEGKANNRRVEFIKQ